MGLFAWPPGLVASVAALVRYAWSIMIRDPGFQKHVEYWFQAVSTLLLWAALLYTIVGIYQKLSPIFKLFTFWNGFFGGFLLFIVALATEEGVHVFKILAIFYLLVSGCVMIGYRVTGSSGE